MEIDAAQPQQTGKQRLPQVQIVDLSHRHRMAAQREQPPVYGEYAAGADGGEVLVSEKFRQKGHSPAEQDEVAQHGRRRRDAKGEQPANVVQRVEHPAGEFPAGNVAQVVHKGGHQQQSSQ